MVWVTEYPLKNCTVINDPEELLSHHSPSDGWPAVSPAHGRLPVALWSGELHVVGVKSE